MTYCVQIWKPCGNESDVIYFFYNIDTCKQYRHVQYFNLFKFKMLLPAVDRIILDLSLAGFAGCRMTFIFWTGNGKLLTARIVTRSYLYRHPQHHAHKRLGRDAGDFTSINRYLVVRSVFLPRLQFLYGQHLFSFFFLLKTPVEEVALIVGDTSHGTLLEFCGK
jgi:hypothetical protein